MNFIHFHNFCTRHRDRHILIIMIGKAYKERILPQIIINIYEGEGIETLSKMVVAVK